MGPVESPFTLLDDGRPVHVPVRGTAGGVWLSPEAARALGWPGSAAWSAGADVELGRLAALCDRPLALDVDERCAFLGVSAVERGRRLASLEAPDFALPDLGGRVHSLAAQRGRKVLLVAYASW